MVTKIPRYWVVLASAGGGSRMNLGRPKQYFAVAGKSVLEWSLAPFLEADWIDGVVLALQAGDGEFARLPIAHHPKIVVVTGGKTRAASVVAGLARVEALTDRRHGPVYVLVHDAARPCVTVDDIERLCDEADDEQGGLLAVPLTETLKKSLRERAHGTSDARALWRAQSPQMFRLDRLQAAMADCLASGAEPADESEAMERAGYHPRLVRGRESNIKITYAEDVPLVEFWLSRAEWLR
ncbi:MAG: 2-C-methyl-D-erythritol 4-phosphate cytidylyltransferase [Nevskiaceae bacterium]|nr:MAG: 2-C-methyl-D-erythritol 4-phosphate cytidylyltransferase [Nevskiaceae bacterium]TBR71771.1 MAG: 2-C-methyl-D-erythritol 4-phosphate cytidylyltransferase [Nevskiaceae bacterium]